MANTAEKVAMQPGFTLQAPARPRVAAKTSALNWAVRISVVVIVLLWLIPTLGLFISSFRDRDQISATGWWKAPLSVELTFRARAPAADQREADGQWLIEGNVFADPEQARWFPDRTGEVTAFGNRGVAPAEFPAGRPPKSAMAIPCASNVTDRSSSPHPKRFPGRDRASISRR